MVRVVAVFEYVEEEEVENDVLDAEEVEVTPALEELCMEELCVEDAWLEEVEELKVVADDELTTLEDEVVVGIVVVDFVEDARSEYPPAAAAITITTITKMIPEVLLIACLWWSFMPDTRDNYEP